MSSLKEHFSRFLEALQKGERVICTRKGAWHVENPLFAKLRSLLGREKKRWDAIADVLIAELDRWERKPLLFGKGANNGELLRFLGAVPLVLKKLELYQTEQRLALRRRFIALLYRLEEENGGFNPEAVDLERVNLLKGEVLEWKQNHQAINEKSLTDRDLLQIQEISRYPEFVALLSDNSTLWEEFLNWAVRDRNEAALFIQYPALQQRLTACNLSSRIGRIDPKGLKISKRPVEGALFEKVVTLLFEGKEQSILDETLRVPLRGNHSPTIAEIFEVFAKKEYKVGDYEYFAQGITNWNVQNWTWWDADAGDYETVDLSCTRWWYQLPIIEIISKDEVEKRHEVKLSSGQWSLAACATRGTRTLDYERSHAFFEIAIPWGDERYAIYDFGKFAFRFPSSFFEGVSIFCHNLHATVSYPDENIFYSHRQQACHGFAATPEQGMQLMEQIRLDMINGQKRDFVYQIESDNCAKWVYKNLEAVFGFNTLPDMFRLHLLKTEPFGLVSWIFAAIRLLPESIQTATMTFFHLPMGAAKSTWIFEKGEYQVKSLTRHEFWETGIVYLPAMLHHQKERGLFTKVVAELCILPVANWCKKLASLAARSLSFFLAVFGRKKAVLLLNPDTNRGSPPTEASLSSPQKSPSWLS